MRAPEELHDLLDAWHAAAVEAEAAKWKKLTADDLKLGRTPRYTACMAASLAMQSLINATERHAADAHARVAAAPDAKEVAAKPTRTGASSEAPTGTPSVQVVDPKEAPHVRHVVVALGPDEASYAVALADIGNAFAYVTNDGVVTHLSIYLPRRVESTARLHATDVAPYAEGSKP